MKLTFFALFIFSPEETGEKIKNGDHHEPVDEPSVTDPDSLLEHHH